MYDPSPPSHYDVALPCFQVESTRKKNLVHLLKCRCGVNSKDNRKSCQSTSNYSSRCNCLRQSKPCTIPCGCRNCSNPFGRRNIQGVRKRRPHKHQINIPSATKFAKHRGESLSNSIGSDFETIILQQIIIIHESPEDILQLYNDVVSYASSFVCTQSVPTNTVVRKKSLCQVLSKFSHMKVS